MIGMNVTGQWFDPVAIRRPTLRALNSVLYRQGAYLRGIARRLIRRVKDKSKKSPPGLPPFTHTQGRGLKDSILFAVGPGSAMIGPSASVIGKIGHTHEVGGTEAEVRYKGRKPNWRFEIGGHGPIAYRDDKWVFAKLYTAGQVERSRQLGQSSDFQADAAADQLLVGRIVKPRRTYPRRPFMGPALQIAQSRLPEIWRNAIVRVA